MAVPHPLARLINFFVFATNRVRVQLPPFVVERLGGVFVGLNVGPKTAMTKTPENTSEFTMIGGRYLRLCFMMLLRWINTKGWGNHFGFSGHWVIFLRTVVVKTMVIIQKERASKACNIDEGAWRQRWPAVKAGLEMTAPPYSVEATA